jgi:hypothetical protein
MTPSLAEHDFLASFAKAAESQGYNAAMEFDAYFTSGYIVKTPEYMLIFTAITESNSWYVHWAEIHPSTRRSGLDTVRTFLRHMPYYLPTVQFARSLKNSPYLKYYSTKRLFSLVGEVCPLEEKRASQPPS